METTMYQSNHRKIALGLSIVPGIGQLYNRQYVKGILFLILSVSFFIVFRDLFDIGLWGLFTLGEVVGRDHSIFLLVEGILAVIVLLFGIGFYVFNLYDAYKNGQKRDLGLKLNTLREQYLTLVDSGFPYLMISPGFILLVFVVIFPIIFVVLLAFTNYDLYHSPPAKLVDWVGFQNFIDLVKLDLWRKTFINVLAWTLVWTFGATTLQIALGIFLAIIVNQKDLKGKAIIRTIFILPWAVPAFVSILVFSGMFNESFGVINKTILAAFGIKNIAWMTDPFWTKVALILIQTWLGFPFIFAMTTGVLQAIPNELYEAATVDGASSWQKFTKITLPLVLYATAPILITQYTFNFNNFNIIYLFNGGGPAVSGQNAGATDILISWIYRLTMTSAQYSKAAAITLLLSLVVVTVALWQFRRTKSFKEEDMM
ncbi:carbohydrate ABC transporter membrane protein 1 (CUT1 family) [Thermolongibacillus altinsuensis]|jgi:arabinogalactan oligomer/maltooligosaccharide transport system permease protein|uniref:Carbohydrate ABC transporter membrane protein 1 (CUT1 family) n=1 Tax=Thermolongibacillus altinsuensis TaxID=575256 RepID=A0A4R1QNG0_9BACL|nr:sugar ABC transporter permease [Thermolongibacillus altinsuensis]TCL51059.1 carbohydrate ABC transporter membrane protein 1 (CUT1 family) [Thermolongibacillus altinsuensis]GMB08870.1 arabinogalactan ABC transporter permease [Thermolongibacillus altinsuensis]